MIGTAVTLLLIFTTAVLVTKHLRDTRRAELLAALTGDLDHAISKADRLGDEFKFDEALASINEIAVRIRDSRHADLALQDRLDNAQTTLRRAEGEYKSKIAMGWEMFESRFVSPDEKKAILDQRKQIELDRETAAQEEIAAKKRAQKEKLAQELAEKQAGLVRLNIAIKQNRHEHNSLAWRVDQALRERRFESLGIICDIRDTRNFECVYSVRDNKSRSPWYKHCNGVKGASSVQIAEMPDRQGLALRIDISLDRDVTNPLIIRWSDREQKTLLNEFAQVGANYLDKTQLSKWIGFVYVTVNDDLMVSDLIIAHNPD